MLAAGSPEPRTRRSAGFTLLELLIVVAIVALASAGVAVALRDGTQVQLEREAERLVALLESARARSQVSGVPVQWRVTDSGFQFDGLDPGQLPRQWLDADTSAVTDAALVLGPEPIIGPQSLTLQSRRQPNKRVRLATDGLRPFAVQPAAP
jgi:general secretion pathway protein H